MIPDGDSSDAFAHWAIVRATIKKDRRILAQVNFTQLTGNAKRSDSQVDATIEKLADGWLKITPTNPLTPGEYALQPVPKVANTFSTVVFDFTIDPKAPNAPDACRRPDRKIQSVSRTSDHDGSRDTPQRPPRSTFAISPTVA